MSGAGWEAYEGEDLEVRVATSSGWQWIHAKVVPSYKYTKKTVTVVMIVDGELFDVADLDPTDVTFRRATRQADPFAYGGEEDSDGV